MSRMEPFVPPSMERIEDGLSTSNAPRVVLSVQNSKGHASAAFVFMPRSASGAVVAVNADTGMCDSW